MVLSPLPAYFLITLLCASANSKLQQADLGTLRREVISTHDVSRKRGPQRGQLGADRECDKPGTAAYQLAQANRTTLDAWSSSYPTDDYLAFD